MSVKIGVVAHISRLAEAEQLADKVDATVISFDDGLMGCTKNHIKVWTNLVQHGADWLVVLEDDAVPVDGFREQLDAALASAPAGIVGLYLGTGYPRAWQRFIKKALQHKDAHYVLSTHVLHAVGTAIRFELVEDMLRWVTWMSQEQRQWPVDEQITEWARRRGHRVAYTRPSLVDHGDLPTLVSHPDGQSRDGIARRAWEVGCQHMWDGSRTVEMP